MKIQRVSIIFVIDCHKIGEFGYREKCSLSSSQKPEGQYDKLYGKQRYCPCILLICDGSHALGFLSEVFLGMGIGTYFKLH